MARLDLRDVWRSEVERYFAFLRDEGFAAPTFDKKLGSAEFVSEEFAITAHFGGRYKELSVDVASVTGPTLKADVADLFVGAGLGPAQAVGHIGRSEHSIRKAVASQAEALRMLLPILKQPSLNLLEKYGRAVPSREALLQSLEGTKP